MKKVVTGYARCDFFYYLCSIMEKLLELYKQWKGAEPANVQQIPGEEAIARITD